ncbi:MAG: hemolysin family protein [Chitinispirillia bacterium]|nr:hemolysin family protein [Chitinispirillia bacterium]MCL2241689.1 hemolysin family protein [Chitinispirillia bacterium]
MDDGAAGIPLYIHIIGLACVFTLSAFFSAIKIIFSATEKSAAGADDERLRYYAPKIGAILKERARLSGTVAIGKTACNISFAAIAFEYHAALFPNAGPVQMWGIPIGISFFALTLFSHYIPRAFALRFHSSYVIPSFYIYKLLSFLLLPFSWLYYAIQSALLSILKYDEKLAFLSEEDKARITAGDDHTEALNEEEREMIRSIFDLSETTVDEIMVPRIKITGAEINADLHTVLTLIRDEGHSRFPVYKNTVDQIVGILYAKDILSWLSEHKPEEWHLPSLMKKCHYVPMGKKINDLMKEFKVKHLHLAVIVDEYGGTAGIATMEDILEEIVGDIQDEYDEEEKAVVQVNENTYLVTPHIELHDLNDELGISLDEDADYNTLGGLIYHEYGDVPLEGTQFEHSGLRITVLKMDNQRIDKVKVEVMQNTDKEAVAEPF